MPLLPSSTSPSSPMKYSCALPPLWTSSTSLGMPTSSIKNALKALFDLVLYLLNCTTLVELGIVPPLLILVVKDENMKAFQRVNNINVLVDLVVVGNRRARENVKSSGDKAMREFREVDGVEVTVRALVSDNSEGFDDSETSTNDSVLQKSVHDEAAEHFITALLPPPLTSSIIINFYVKFSFTLFFSCFH
ncbi:hypothetical protein MUK42_19734 [Musa troglodytarum]|uniref:Uncharacterized protein n=1 Tax=Musa troglodytarum TaxID=320322 RepID=A0A9E7G2J1_9LILI|nr:hypothetical protein MUK42_19734 [Musa troglodytarum]